jgi:hypothetical protein
VVVLSVFIVHPSRGPWLSYYAPSTGIEPAALNSEGSCSFH